MWPLGFEVGNRLAWFPCHGVVAAADYESALAESAESRGLGYWTRETKSTGAWTQPLAALDQPRA
jgi:hypothetical protein